MAKKKTGLLIAVGAALILCAALIILLPTLIGSGEEQSAPVRYTVEVKTEGGMPLSEIMVYVYKDLEQKALVWASETDSDGRISFEAVRSDSYTAVLQDVPVGYKTEESYLLTADHTEINPEIVLPDSNSLADAVFGLGDVFCDLTVTAADGEKYSISGLLEEKKAVVLNFWFINCGPCRMEFPYLQKAYEEYKDDIEVIALNPVDGTDDNIASFARDLGLTFPMAVLDAEWESRMKLTAYPTTVIIDRYGTIGMIHKGSITETETFKKIFEYFISDEYKQTTVRNIEDIG